MELESSSWSGFARWSVEVLGCECIVVWVEIWTDAVFYVITDFVFSVSQLILKIGIETLVQELYFIVGLFGWVVGFGGLGGLYRAWFD